MKRYKLIGTQISWPSFTPGKIYDADYVADANYPNYTVEYYADIYPSEWKLVEDDFILPEKYVLKQNDMEIIGYKLKKDCEQYESAAAKLFNVSKLYGLVNAPCDIDTLTKAKVLDIWFEPVYKENFKLPTISGYNGVDLGDKVKYGLQTYKVEDIKTLYKSLSILNGESVKLHGYSVNVSIDQILEIIKYFENK